mgnify:FL=1
MVLAIIIGFILIAVCSFFIGQLSIRNQFYKTINENYFGTMVVNMDLIENDNFIETRFNESPRNMLGKEFVIFEVKIRE